MYIDHSDFAPGELDKTLSQLIEFDQDDTKLTQVLQKYFTEFDSDSNEHLDRKELRLFLDNFFKTYHIVVPLTNEYVDATFREIDANRDNKI